MGLRIVSLNAWGGREWHALRQWLPNVAADVLCLQEMIRAPQPSPEWLRYSDANRDLAQRSDLFADVSACLPDHQAWFSPAARGPLLDEAGVRHMSEHGLGAWVARDLAMSERLSRFVHGTYRADGWGEEPVPRTLQVMRIAREAGALIVAHMHGLRDSSGKTDTPERLAQARAAVAHLEALRRPGDGVILMGDFNILPDSACFEVFAQAGLHDLVARYGITDTRTALYEKPQRHANYCLVSDTVSVKAFSAPAEPVVSDHRPLILDVL